MAAAPPALFASTTLLVSRLPASKARSAQPLAASLTLLSDTPSLRLTAAPTGTPLTDVISIPTLSPACSALNPFRNCVTTALPFSHSAQTSSPVGVRRVERLVLILRCVCGS